MNENESYLWLYLGLNICCDLQRWRRAETSEGETLHAAHSFQ